MVALGDPTTAESLTDETVRSYHDRGFVHLPQVLSPEEVATFRAAAEELLDKEGPEIWGASAEETQVHYVEAAWLKHPDLRRLALHPVITEIAERLSGGPLRLYGTDVLKKDPHVHLPTVIHDDEPGLPLAGLSRTLTAWTPLVDVPADRGSLIYVPGSHLRPETERQVHLAGFEHYRPMEEVWPDFPYAPRVTVPARAGDVIFHHFRTVHLAGVNTDSERRLAYGVVYMDADATYRPGVQDHPVAHLRPGEPVAGEKFPLIRPA
ncbi:phytanoyl-CoA dioxygenase family protein [Actinomadura craniellae]|uniref:Phytanoyl-CoA dioxygenase family protein n=2 Tax=Actinomadura craniellae TaxID=2231787 RepID=A0A365H0T0_9ACTN|nr:phytanoyl-CoA dioxygenase family protein [Actinomadura craniellae]